VPPPEAAPPLATQRVGGTVTLAGGAAVRHARPGLLMHFGRPGAEVDFVLRLGLPRCVREGGEEASAGEPIPGGAAEDAAIEVGGADVLPGLAEGLDGIRAGETRTITAFLPLRNAPPGLAGREVRFAVTAKALRRRVVPPIDDALALALGHMDLAALREAPRGRGCARRTPRCRSGACAPTCSPGSRSGPTSPCPNPGSRRRRRGCASSARRMAPARRRFAPRRRYAPSPSAASASG
jgi:hypothetical protein